MTARFAVDFETYYDAKVSVQLMPEYQYCMHPDAVPYLMSVHNDDFTWVGDPREFQKWDMFHDAQLACHNAHFDPWVWERLCRDRVIPRSVVPSGWIDTADLASYRRYPRSLGALTPVLLGYTLNKGMREQAKGKTVAALKGFGLWDDMVKYGSEDAVACWRALNKLLPEWPAHEQEISRLNRNACFKGVAVDRTALERNLDILNTFLWKVERDIPWEWDPDETPLKPKAIRAECAKEGISCPASFAKDSVDCAAWEDEHAAKYPWVRGIRHWRRVAFIRQKMQQLRDGCDESGIYRHSLRYCGADTGRFAAGSGKRGDAGRFSMHGMPKFPIYVDPINVRFHDGATGKLEDESSYERVDLRNMIVARPGHTLIVWDLAQIEPRLVHWASGNRALLDSIRTRGVSVYQAEAELAYNWKGENLKKEDPQMYHMIKTAYLGGQYQCGWKKLKTIAIKAGIELDDKQASEIITGFRTRNSGIVRLWSQFQNDVHQCLNKGEDYHLRLPSGRLLDYIKVRLKDGDFGQEVAAEYIKGDTPWKIYGGLLTNNLIQGTGRDVLCHKCLELDKTEFGWPLWTVHDEAVHEVPEEVGERVGDLKRIVETDIPWLPGLPLGAEVVVSNHYLK